MYVFCLKYIFALFILIFSPIISSNLSINTLIKENEVEKIIEEDDIDLHDNNYEKYILDLSLSYETRIKLIHRYYIENQNNAIEIISRISGMYQFSGAKILEKYLIDM